MNATIRIMALAFVAMAACSDQPTGGRQEATTLQSRLVGTAWAATDASAALGTLRIFLPDGTLVMDSCFETYRLARWRALDGRRVEWDEDGERIEAEMVLPDPDTLQIRLRLRDGISVTNYARAQVPYLCPDLPR